MTDDDQKRVAEDAEELAYLRDWVTCAAPEAVKSYGLLLRLLDAETKRADEADRERERAEGNAAARLEEVRELKAALRDAQEGRNRLVDLIADVELALNPEVNVSDLAFEPVECAQNDVLPDARRVVRERDEARAEGDTLRDVLTEISEWSEDCHEHDEDMGHEPRDLDAEMVHAMEQHAARALVPEGE